MITRRKFLKSAPVATAAFASSPAIVESAISNTSVEPEFSIDGIALDTVEIDIETRRYAGGRRAGTKTMRIRMHQTFDRELTELEVNGLADWLGYEPEDYADISVSFDRPAITININHEPAWTDKDLSRLVDALNEHAEDGRISIRTS